MAQVILPDSQRQEQVHSLINSVVLAQEINSEGCNSQDIQLFNRTLRFNRKM